MLIMDGSGDVVYNTTQGTSGATTLFISNIWDKTLSGTNYTKVTVTFVPSSSELILCS